MRAEIPDKLYFKIGEVSKLACVDPHVLRYWESEFSEIRPKRTHSNQRLYKREDVETILVIKSLLHEQKYTISGAKKFLQTGGKEVVQPEVTAGEKQYLKEIKKELLALGQLLKKKYK